MVRVRRFGVLQTAKVVGVIYALISLVIVTPVFMFGSMMSEEFFPELEEFGAIALVMIPIVYGIIGFIFTAISCVIYNLISSFTGGVEVEIEQADTSV